MPYHKELKFGTEAHDRVRDAVRQRFQMSKRKMSTRYQAWTEAENLYLSYVPEKEEERKRKEAQKNGETTFAQVVIPYSYATLLTAHTYWASVFLSRAPVLQYTARHGEAHQKVQAVEALIDYQVNVGRMLMPLYLWLLDAGKYGMGVVGYYWTEETTVVSSFEDVEVTYLGLIKTGKTKRQLVSKPVRGYVGNRLYNVRPQDFFPDPRVALSNFQQGEFCAVHSEVSYNNLLKSSEGYFNLDVLKERRSANGDIDRTVTSSQIELPDKAASYSMEGASGKTPDKYSVVEMVWELVPSEWGLGDSGYPEKWVVTVAENDVVVGCRPQGANHAKFPYSVITYEMDGYSHSLRGMMEVIQPLARTLDWLFNSHFFNVRKSLNDQLIVDPSRIVLKDLLDGGPGKLIRVNPAAYGTDVRSAISQLPVTDVTRANIADADMVMQMIQRILGVTDNIMGMVNTSGRKTATEVRTSTSFGVNRLKTFAEYNSAQGWAPLSEALLQNTQQLLDEDRQYKIAGDLLRGDPQFLMVGPEQITGFFDFVPVDGTMPVDRFAQANLWKEILMGLAQAPAIASQYDIAGIFSWMAQLAGLKNITQFKLAPDQVVQQMAQQGALVPQKGGSANVGNAAGGSPAVQTRSGLTPGAPGVG